MTGPAASPVAGVVLAAGSSRRAGATDKLLAPIEGEAMVRRVARTALEAGLRPVLVVSAGRGGAVETALEGLDVVLVPNPDAARGLGTSLARGVHAVPPHREAAVVLLGDMPWVLPDTVRVLVDAFREAAEPGPCVPVHGGRRGNPVLWPRRFFPSLASVEGDEGGRAILTRLGDEVLHVKVPDGGVHRDVDTPEDLAALSEPSTPDESESPCPS